MKKLLVVLLAVTLVLALGVAGAFAQWASTTPAGSFGKGIVGTPHDLRGSAYIGNGAVTGTNTTGNGTETRICVYCHTPHHSYKSTDPNTFSSNYLPLWNHTLSAIAPASYKVYTSGSLGPDSSGNTMLSPGGMSDPGRQFNATQTGPGPVSRLCLSCHDGTVAVNQYGSTNPNQSNAFEVSNGSSKIAYSTGRVIGGVNGNDLSNQHPIGFAYAAVAQADNEIADANSTVMVVGAGGTLYIGDLLYGGQMECATCHSVHNTRNQGEKFLWKSDNNSGLCLTCHLKGTNAP